MFGKGITLFRMFGFTVKADLSWLIIVALVIWSLAGGVFPQEFAGLSWGTYLLMGIGGAAGLFISIVFHELSHSLVARRFDLPIKGITLFIFGGVAEMSEEPKSPKAEFLMAAAGPVFSFFMGMAFYLAAGATDMLGGSVLVTAVLAWLGLINIILAVFNLIPGFPLDGGRVLRSALWAWKKDQLWATRIASQIGSGLGIALVALGFLSLLMLNPIGGLWWILIGMFLRSAARQSYQQVLMRTAFGNETVGKFMNAQPVVVSPEVNLASLVDDYIYRHHFKLFPVVDGDRLTGCVTTRQLSDVPRELWTAKHVRDIAVDCGVENTIGPDEPAMEAIRKMNQSQSSRLLVVDAGRLVGIISLKDLLQVFSLKMELHMTPAAKRAA